MKIVRQQKNAILNSCGVLKTRSFPEIDELLSTITQKYDDVERAMHDYFDDHSVLSLINNTWTTDVPDDFVEQFKKKMVYGSTEFDYEEKNYELCMPKAKEHYLRDG